MILHASVVAFGPRGLLIVGPSGSGKSALALALMSMGAELVADDQVLILAERGALIATRPPTLPKLIEARQIGLLHANGPDRVVLTLAADLGAAEPQRLPPDRWITFLGIDLPLARIAGLPHGPHALRQYMLQGRHPSGAA